jgi:protein tyrosine phosphatase (PTP) superfamily phosphohydrolase (DUF442 family)
MTLSQYLRLGLASSLMLGAGCRLCRDNCGENPGLFGWRERARERERERERNNELDPTRPRLGDPIRPRDNIPAPEIPFSPSDSRPPTSIPDSRYRVSDPIGPSPGSWVGPTLEAPRRSDKIILEPDPYPSGPTSPPLLLDIPSEPQSISRVLGLEDPIRPQELSKPTPIPAVQPLPAKPELLPPIERKVDKLPSLEEPLKPNFAASGTLPGLFTVPGFTDVYTGRKPTLEGFEKLKSSGVRTVVYLHAPKADLSAPRNMAEKSGLSFEPIEVSASRLAEAKSEFSEAVKSSGKRPIFIFDETGSRAGVLWYLYFREQQHNDELARVRSGPLGLNSLGNSADDQSLWAAARELNK